MRSLTFVLALALSALIAGERPAASAGDLLLTIPNPSSTDSTQFGQAVAGVGGNLVVGVPYALAGGMYNAGRVHVFDGVTGTLLFTISNPDPDNGDTFGFAVAVASGNILVGAPGDDTAGGTEPGAAYLFDAVTGALLATVLPLAPGQFGWSIAALGSTFLVGAPTAQPGGVVGAGEVHVVSASTGALLLSAPNPAPEVFDVFGMAVAAAGENLLVGAQWDDPGGVYNAGSAYLLEGGASAQAAFRNAGANPASYSAENLPVLGGTYTGAVDLAGTTGHNLAWLVGYATPLTLALGGGQTLLVNVADPSGELLAQPFQPGPVATYDLPVPADLSFVGFAASTQALHVGGVQPFALSNAQDLRLGF
ncbi:MAG: FG-GAP repeat protein [Planctomycetota bacterium]